MSELDGITIEVQADTITNTGLELIINNSTTSSCITGEWYAIEKKHNND